MISKNELKVTKLCVWWALVIILFNFFSNSAMELIIVNELVTDSIMIANLKIVFKAITIIFGTIAILLFLKSIKKYADG